MSATLRTGGLLAALVACLLVPSHALATYPGANGKIAFERVSSDGTNQVLTMNGDGSDQSPLVSGRTPAWTSNGARIAYSCQQGGGAICSAKADGSSEAVLGGQCCANSNPTWSPDSARLLWEVVPYCHPCNVPAVDLWRMDADGSDQIYFRSGGDPDWSPDGKRIAYVDNPATNAQVALMAPNNTDRLLLTGGPGENYAPSWSPDDKIAFVSRRDGNDEIYVMDQNGNGQTRLTNDSAHDVFPEWSPDGRKIAFASDRGGNYDIYVMNADGSGVQRLTSDPVFESSPDWQPIRPQVPRPKGATPTRVALVPAFHECTAPDSTHGSPLSFGSCTSPTSTGQFGVFGYAPPGGSPKSTGYVRFAVSGGDVQVAAALTDVRRTFDLADLPGELDLALPERITDNQNGGALVTPATVKDLGYIENPLHVPIPCAETADTTVGSTCSVQTTLNALIPPSSPQGPWTSAGYRAMWQLGQIAVYDGGEDGYIQSRDDNTVLAVQGVFVP